MSYVIIEIQLTFFGVGIIGSTNTISYLVYGSEGKKDEFVLVKNTSYRYFSSPMFHLMRSSQLSSVIRRLVSTMATIEFNPQRLLATRDYAVVILNTEILLKKDFFFKVWNNAIIRHVIDGGANTFFSLYDKLTVETQETTKFPDIASGDFDSISDDSMARLKDKSQRCKIIPTEDQDETDFTKGLKVLKTQLDESGQHSDVKRVVVICECSGRIDQIQSNFNTLHKHVFMAEPILNQPQVYILSASSLSWLLPGNYESVIKFEEDDPSIVCGIIPLQGPTRYRTKGLKWDLCEDMECKFGGLISSSNQIAGEHVSITPIQNHSIFCLELHEDKYVL